MTDYFDDALPPNSAVWDGLQTLPNHALRNKFLLPSQSSSHPVINENVANTCPVKSYDLTPSTYEQPVTESQDLFVARHSPVLQPMNYSSEGPSAPNGILNQIGEPSADNLTINSGPREDVWESHKSMITDLYAKKPLREVIETMKRKYEFKARHVPEMIYVQG